MSRVSAIFQCSKRAVVSAKLACCGVAISVALVGNTQAQPIMPDLSSVPTGWTTDRYAPNSFSNVGMFQGRDNVLGIGISSAQNAASRGAQSAMFYNTQGKQHAVTGGAGASLSADLYIDAAWSSNTSGSVRSDMWGVMRDDIDITDYPIIGFTNEGNNARYRVFDQNAPGGWIDLTSTAVTYGAWTSFKMVYTGGTNLEFFVNGSLVYTDTSIGYSEPSQSFSAVSMQAYNFGDPANFPSEVVADYTAHWSNTVAAVPEPETYALLLAGLGMIAAFVRRRRQFS